jgi:transposase
MDTGFVLSRKHEFMKERRRGRRYDAQFKEQAVQVLLNSGKSLHAVAQGLGVTDNALKDWKHQYLNKSNGKDLITKQLEMENQRLRRELERVTTQRDILKKSLGILSEQPPQKDMPK